MTSEDQMNLIFHLENL